jgi:hypothetical protein
MEEQSSIDRIYEMPFYGVEIMTFDEIATAVRSVIYDHFDLSSDLPVDSAYLWDDLYADDLDFIEIFNTLEERLDRSDLDNIELDSFRLLTVYGLIEHINLIMNPIIEEAFQEV